MSPACCAQAESVFVNTLQSTISTGSFSPSNALWAQASESINVNTDFTVNPQTSLPSRTQPGIAAFRIGGGANNLQGATEIKVLLGGLSASTVV